MKNTFAALLLFSITFSSGQEQKIITDSKYLKRKIETSIYDTKPELKGKPIVYVTDGRNFLNNGSMKMIETLTKQGKIKPAYYIFTSTIDPKSGKDHRNEYFFTNPTYINFYEKELLPAIENELSTFDPSSRSLIGISFGGLNAAYFSAKSTAFKNFGVLSPITYPRKNVYQDISFSENQDLRIFLSSGKNDAESYTQKLEELYRSKGYEMEVLYTEGAHDFDNWNGQLEQMLNFLLN